MHLVGEKQGVFRVVKLQKVLGGIVMDAVMKHPDAVGIRRGEEGRAGALPLANPVPVNFTVLYIHIAALPEGDGVIAALIDAAAGNAEAADIVGIHADGTAAVETAGLHPDIRAVFQAQNTAGAETGLPRMARGEI